MPPERPLEPSGCPAENAAENGTIAVCQIGPTGFQHKIEGLQRGAKKNPPTERIPDMLDRRMHLRSGYSEPTQLKSGVFA